MKKQTAAIAFLTMLCFLLVTWLPCHATDNALYVCKNNKTGAPRLVKSPTLCKAKTEYLVTLTPGNTGPNYFEFNSLNEGDVNVTSTWTKLNTGSTHLFTKSQDGTTIEVHVNSRIDGGTFNAGANGIVFEIRIDDNILPGFKNYGAIRTTNTVAFQSIYAVFQNLAAGSHTVSLWASTYDGTSTGVGVDPGGWGGTIIVKEE